MITLCIISGETLRQIDWLAAAMLLIGLLMMAAFIARTTVENFRRRHRTYVRRRRTRLTRR